MSDPIQSRADLIFMSAAGVFAAMVAWRPRQTLARVFGRRRAAAVPDRVLQFDQAAAALAAFGIAAVLIGHFFPGLSLW